MSTRQLCPECGQLVPPSSSSRLYCSGRCRSRVSSRKWVAANPEYYGKWRASNIERLRGYDRARPARSRGLRGPEYLRKWREAHPELTRAYQRKWVAANPEYAREYQRAIVTINGEQLNFNVASDELKELATLLKQARKIIRQADSGGSK